MDENELSFLCLRAALEGLKSEQVARLREIIRGSEDPATTQLEDLIAMSKHCRSRQFVIDMAHATASAIEKAHERDTAANMPKSAWSRLKDS